MPAPRYSINNEASLLKNVAEVSRIKIIHFRIRKKGAYNVVSRSWDSLERGFEQIRLHPTRYAREDLDLVLSG